MRDDRHLDESDLFEGAGASALRGGRGVANVANAGAQLMDRAPSARAAAIARNLAVHDWIALAYLTLIPSLLWMTPQSAARDRMISHHLALLVCVAGAIVAQRSEVLPRSFAVGGMYRVALVATTFVTYLLLGEALPVLNSRSLDRELYHLDLALFGFEPAVMMERWATPAVTDWFALFYVGYFAILGLFVLPMVFFSKNERLLGELALTMMLTFGVGQSVYALVPGFGPLTALPEAFHSELRGGIFFGYMNAIVSGAGAKKDIFPSLHTAVPVALTLLAFRHRKGRVMRWVWPPIMFVTANIVIATMFLRWHYLIDVVAGLVLAIGSHFGATRITDWELDRRRGSTLSALWPLWPNRSGR
jgi:hypothetical protein